ncbi:enoyl-CoA hydratase [Microvirga flavescens]|uniref:enoyl-CoA hydratase n=1 Tax=Microvirga flavescens TaxID=2249811 RepID=UPI000DD91B90|nr:enoyl-CoA hydratase [Microvirga flavescens]
MSAVFSSPSPLLSVTVEDSIASIAIDNPARRNALNLSMWQAFPAIVKALEEDERVRVIILRGAGTGAFAAGADIAEFETIRADAAGSRAYERDNEAAFWAIAHCAKPVIAMIRSHCLGAGCGLAVACDLRIASDNAVFGIPAARLGVGYPPGAMRLLTAVVGPTVAKDLFFTARRIDAGEALRLGLLGTVVPDEALEETTLTLARTIAENAPLTIRAAKAAIDAACGVGEPGLDTQALADACFDSADYVEGRSAFLEKRKPVFKGR